MVDVERHVDQQHTFVMRVIKVSPVQSRYGIIDNFVRNVKERLYMTYQRLTELNLVLTNQNLAKR